MNQKRIRLLVTRVVLGCLIALNLFMIFHFSSQNAAESNATSGQVSGVVADIVVKDYEEKPADEKEEIRQKIDPVVRKLAHMSEFGLLGALCFLLLLTWQNRLWLQYVISVGSVLLVACTDELFQKFSDGRAAQWQDVLIDFLGAVLFCGVILLTVFFVRSRKRMKGND